MEKTVQVPRLVVLVAALLGVGLVLVDGLLLVRNRDLQSQVGLLAKERYLQVGDAVPPLAGIGPHGESVRVSYEGDGQKTLLLVFSPLCGWCERNLGNWEAIAAATDAASFRTVAVSVNRDEVESYVSARSLFAGMPVIADLEIQGRLDYKLLDTPQTLVIDDHGRVEKVWVGALSGSRRTEAERFFGTTLPGLPSTEPADL